MGGEEKGADNFLKNLVFGLQRDLATSFFHLEKDIWNNPWL